MLETADTPEKKDDEGQQRGQWCRHDQAKQLLKECRRHYLFLEFVKICVNICRQ